MNLSRPRATGVSSTEQRTQNNTLPPAAPSVPPGAAPAELSTSALLELRHPDDQLRGLSWRNLAAAIALGAGADSQVWR